VEWHQTVSYAHSAMAAEQAKQAQSGKNEGDMKITRVEVVTGMTGLVMLKSNQRHPMAKLEHQSSPWIVLLSK
jgi:hypothetical protein